MDDLLSLPYFFKAYPQRGVSFMGNTYDPLMDCNLSLDSNRASYLEVKQLTQPRFSPQSWTSC